MQRPAFTLNLANALQSVTISNSAFATKLQKDKLCGAPDCHLQHTNLNHTKINCVNVV